VEPAPERARLTSAVLDRQISEWTTAYTETRAREAALPPRTAHVEKVTTHRYAADAYERDWQDKVERVGNLNYPEEARRKNLSGGLLLSVGVNADGSLKGITVAKSSGHAELDEAAVRIVRLAAPFAPFPSQLKTDYDVLLITRTWRFFTDHHLATAP
jgi:protein TonB